ncbi:MAG: hypothetical protein JXR67_02740 [Bacteroidales bacterium]|nr:hypothetical protein [Bacteroidales bacterium]
MIDLHECVNRFYEASRVHGSAGEPQLVIAYDEDDCMPVRSWHPSDNGWTILLTEEGHQDW